MAIDFNDPRLRITELTEAGSTCCFLACTMCTWICILWMSILCAEGVCGQICVEMVRAIDATCVCVLTGMCVCVCVCVCGVVQKTCKGHAHLVKESGRNPRAAVNGILTIVLQNHMKANPK